MDDGTDPTPPASLLKLFRNEPERIGSLVAKTLANSSDRLALPAALNSTGLGPEQALDLVTPYLRGGARQLGDPGFFAHMDPPTPWVTWVAALLGASSNQNLLHTDTAPAARDLEATTMEWIAPAFGMGGGHLVPGSTVANLTALWAARDLTGADTVVASANSHLSIAKAAAILGLRYLPVEPGPDRAQAVTAEDFAAVFDPADAKSVRPESTIVVATAGTTGVGAIDALDLSGLERAPAWTHVDAAWAGPLRFSARYRERLSAIVNADSIAVSAHKWLFQPKESALVLFKDVEPAHRAISVGGAYLQVPNIGILGSHGTAAAPLAATLVTLGWDGLEALIDHTMAIADRLVALIDRHDDLVRFGPNDSGIIAWRHRVHDSAAIGSKLSGAFVSAVDIDGETWLRSVAANPMANPERVVTAVESAAAALDREKS